MRIVAGSVRGRRIEAPVGARTRPTSDRVREALFGRLDAWGAVSSAAVLDLFCGSGALALEALSRGAATAVGVDADRRACAVARRNAAGLGLALDVVTADATTWARTATGSFDLVLLDPPYDLPDGTLAALLESLVPLCAAEAVVVVERSTRSGAPRLPEPWEALQPRVYGETTVWFAQPR